MFLLINKPAGITSHDVIDRLRLITGQRRIGHAGTLDPFATGLLIVGVGRESTKQLNQFLKLNKSYTATLVFGATSDTQDVTGRITPTPVVTPLSPAAVAAAVTKFQGQQLQTPPMYSAKKIQGKKLYELARQGKTVKRQPAEIEIKKIAMLDYTWPRLTITVECSSGTYIRMLGHDLGANLGVGAYVEALQRTAIGKYQLADAVGLDKLMAENWQGYTF